MIGTVKQMPQQHVGAIAQAMTLAMGGGAPLPLLATPNRIGPGRFNVARAVWKARQNKCDCQTMGMRNKGYKDQGFLPWAPVVHPTRVYTAPKVRTADMADPINRLKGAILSAKLSGSSSGGGDRGVRKAKQELKRWLAEDRAAKIMARDREPPANITAMIDELLNAVG